MPQDLRSEEEREAYKEFLHSSSKDVSFKQTLSTIITTGVETFEKAKADGASAPEPAPASPRADSRSEVEVKMFGQMLKEVNLIYLGCRVLILLDRQYMGRFWVSATGSQQPARLAESADWRLFESRFS